MHELRTFEEILSATNQFDITFIAHAPVPGNAITWSSQAEIPQVKSALLLIGPEGGFSEDELEKAIASGYRFLHLGPTRLRSETAGLVAAALLLNQLDNR